MQTIWGTPEKEKKQQKREEFGQTPFIIAQQPGLFPP
jgi:hypothetical protein